MASFFSYFSGYGATVVYTFGGIGVALGLPVGVGSSSAVGLILSPGSSSKAFSNASFVGLLPASL
ncbi:hypothetical protein A2U01_0090209, partial [Trifolium medium]|nr:hypothetical protein [Trifolium medium]